MKAMILAAGLGTRLRPLTNDLPKPLLPIGGQPLIFHHLELLKNHGITDIIINVHYHGDKIIERVGNGDRFGMKITYSQEPEILGTGGGIKKIQSALGAGPFIVMNADILVRLDLGKLVSFHQKRGGCATLVLREEAQVNTYGVIALDPQDQIRDILGKVRGKDSGKVRSKEKGSMRRLMFTGIHVIESRVFDYIPSGKFYSIIDAYVEMLRQDELIAGYLMDGYWNDIGVLERYEKADQDFEQGLVR
ncbi:MAG: nucleotidyltransferase family protein [Nitrospira sp.]|nr:nucleotidyltransferase family protein [Candidatus Manganitrophaceae bacterium]HIL34769.1 nucleotidyltransferase family protein [Candidatus Manganitrophaceae bacterium]